MCLSAACNSDGSDTIVPYKRTQRKRKLNSRFLFHEPILLKPSDAKQRTKQVSYNVRVSPGKNPMVPDIMGLLFALQRPSGKALLLKAECWTGNHFPIARGKHSSLQHWLQWNLTSILLPAPTWTEVWISIVFMLGNL